MHGHHDAHMRKGTNSAVKPNQQYIKVLRDLGSKFVILKQSRPAI